tara:strand:- start:709 stop:2046 length:1338 start_codon:yes stop_codon:yes gene_type:complete
MAAKTKAEKRAAQVKEAKAHLAASAAAYKRTMADVVKKGVSYAGIDALAENEGRHADPRIIERREGEKTYYTIGSGHLLDNSAEAIAAFKKAWGPPRDDGGVEGKGWKTKRNELLKGEGTIPDDVIDALFAYDANRKVDATRKMFSKNNNEKTTMFHTLAQDTRDALFGGMFRGEFKRPHTTVQAIIAGDSAKAARNYRAGGRTGKRYRLAGEAARRLRIKNKKILNKRGDKLTADKRKLLAEAGYVRAPNGIREDLGRAMLSEQGHRILTTGGKLYPSTTGVVKRMMDTQNLLDRDAAVAKLAEDDLSEDPDLKDTELVRQEAVAKAAEDDLLEDPDLADPELVRQEAAAAKAAVVPAGKQRRAFPFDYLPKYLQDPIRKLSERLGPEKVSSAGDILGPILNGERLAFAIASTNSTQYPAEIDKTDPDTVHSDTELPGGGAFNA